MTHADTFYIVDLDRTLINTDRMSTAFLAMIRGHLDDTVYRQTIDKFPLNHLVDSFDAPQDVYRYFLETNQLDEWERLRQGYIAYALERDMSLPGAKGIIDRLTSGGFNYGILTYGDPMWQEVKREAAGFGQTPCIITTEKEKGHLIRRWQRADGNFLLPPEFGGHSVQQIILIDDKAVSFDSFPSGPSRGWWVLDPAHELPQQQGTVPANVARVSHLDDVIL